MEDVAFQLGLHVDGRPVTGPTYYDWEQMCVEYIGIVPPENALVGSTLKLKWLKVNMFNLPAEHTPQQLATHYKAYILGLIGVVLMLDKSGDRVHLMYLPLLAYLDRVGRYIWGSTCLAHLYREMCMTIYPTSKKMEGCIMLLQSWAWYRMSFIQPRVEH